MERLKHIVEINIVLGTWLIVAPFVMGYSVSTTALANDVVLGLLFVACSWWILRSTAGRISGGALELVGGVWLIAAPFVLHYQRSSRPFDNDLVLGVLAVLIGATAMWMLASRRRLVRRLM